MSPGLMRRAWAALALGLLLAAMPAHAALQAAAHGHRWFANRLADLACLAEDRATMKAALARIDGEPEAPKPKSPAPIEGGIGNQT